ncbi:hypothetical protein BDP27DRAFT_1416905 [Rhodocollybia butyracea]|uniref:Uncharacterized protein n=1 Tax=Rhodocollybia butyracea TaxID=206335 RepID=A0A9P5UC75_9AGAR|nr:hypothetical protein BDP27DRAFT_1416905 [Rhodocollybia butyracea]
MSLNISNFGGELANEKTQTLLVITSGESGRWVRRNPAQVEKARSLGALLYGDLHVNDDHITESVLSLDICSMATCQEAVSFAIHLSDMTSFPVLVKFSEECEERLRGNGGREGGSSSGGGSGGEDGGGGDSDGGGGSGGGGAGAGAEKGGSRKFTLVAEWEEDNSPVSHSLIKTLFASHPEYQGGADLECSVSIYLNDSARFKFNAGYIVVSSDRQKCFELDIEVSEKKPEKLTSGLSGTVTATSPPTPVISATSAKQLRNFQKVDLSLTPSSQSTKHTVLENYDVSISPVMNFTKPPLLNLQVSLYLHLVPRSAAQGSEAVVLVHQIQVENIYIIETANDRRVVDFNNHWTKSYQEKQVLKIIKEGETVKVVKGKSKEIIVPMGPPKLCH